MSASQTIVVLDYGMGNLRSMAQAMQHAAPEAKVIISSNAQQVLAADRLVLPGQGAMPDCMAALAASGLARALETVLKSRPILGVCVGMQMLFEHSAEGNVAALGHWAGNIQGFSLTPRIMSGTKVPHMGWNTVRPMGAHPLWQDIPTDSYFYFVHSYYAPESKVTAATTEYGGVVFASAVAHENIFATQFHPEKSADAGLQLCRNFCDWQP